MTSGCQYEQPNIILFNRNIAQILLLWMHGRGCQSVLGFQTYNRALVIETFLS